MGRISLATRDELVVAVAGRYALGNRMERGRILDEFAAVTGHHRKHAMRLLRAGMTRSSGGPRPGRRLYGEAIRQALIVIWEASDRICGKRLRPLVPILIEAMERHGHLDLAPEVRSGLLGMSAATIDRALREARGPTGGRRRAHHHRLRSGGAWRCGRSTDGMTRRLGSWKRTRWRIVGRR